MINIYWCFFNIMLNTFEGGQDFAYHLFKFQKIRRMKFWRTKLNVFKFQSSGQKNLFVTVKQIRKFEGTTEDITKYCPSFNSSKNELHDSLKAAMKFKYLGEHSYGSHCFSLRTGWIPKLFWMLILKDFT